MKVGSGRSAIRRMARRPRLWVWLSVAVVVLGFGLGFVPLFNVLGYELAIAVSIVAALAGLDLGAALARELQWMDAHGLERAMYPGRALARTTCAAAALAVAVTLPPGIIAAVRGIWVPTCDWWFGIKAYLLLPVATAALGGALGHVLGVAVGSRAPGRARDDRRFALGYAALLGLLLGLILAIASEHVVAGLLVGAALAAVLALLFWLLAPHRSTLVAIAPALLVAGAALYGFYAAPP
ncbi:MAG TPA: hypothetical protein VL219_02490, partial [Steroidobacteraceae bacterium]|nr:hypothetical protein [Steroidobacteraceae bacterium]